MKYLNDIRKTVAQLSWKKLGNPTVESGKTAWPKGKADQEKYGIRFDFHREELVKTSSKSVDGKAVYDTYYHFVCQANAGKVPAAIKTWLKGRTTHAVMARFKVKKDSSQEEVEDIISAAFDSVE